MVAETLLFLISATRLTCNPNNAKPPTLLADAVAETDDDNTAPAAELPEGLAPAHEEALLPLQEGAPVDEPAWEEAPLHDNVQNLPLDEPAPEEEEATLQDDPGPKEAPLHDLALEEEPLRDPSQEDSPPRPPSPVTIRNGIKQALVSSFPYRVGDDELRISNTLQFLERRRWHSFLRAPWRLTIPQGTKSDRGGGPLKSGAASSVDPSTTNTFLRSKHIPRTVPNPVANKHQ